VQGAAAGWVALPGDVASHAAPQTSAAVINSPEVTAQGIQRLVNIAVLHETSSIPIPDGNGSDQHPCEAHASTICYTDAAGDQAPSHNFHRKRQLRRLARKPAF
jgi:hypothetical protein